jgi:hypothetical protein
MANPVLSSSVTSRTVAAAIIAEAATTGRDNKRSSSSSSRGGGGSERAVASSATAALRISKVLPGDRFIPGGAMPEPQSYRRRYRTTIWVIVNLFCDVIGKMGI